MDENESEGNWGLLQEEVNILAEFSGIAWIILSSLWNKQKLGGCNSNKEDLLKSVPRSFRNSAKQELERLDGVINCRKHTGGPVCSGNPHHWVFKDEHAISILEKIREDGSFKEALLHGRIEFGNEDPIILEALHKVLNPRIDNQISSYKILRCPTLDDIDKGDMRISLSVIFLCPKRSSNQCGDTQEIIFELDDISSINSELAIIENCAVCNSRHQVMASGRIYNIS